MVLMMFIYGCNLCIFSYSHDFFPRVQRRGYWSTYCGNPTIYQARSSIIIVFRALGFVSDRDILGAYYL